MTTIWAATSDGLYRIGGPDPEVALPEHSVSFMAQVGPTPQGGPEMRAIVDEHQIWGLPDGGEWAKVASLPGFRGNCLAFTDRWLIGSAEAHLFEVEDGTTVALERFDAAPGRHEWYTPWGGPPDTRSIAEWDEHVYVNVHVGGIVRTADAGASWTPTIDIDADVHQVTTAEGALVLAACADGLAVSSDHGDTWEERADGLDARYARGVTVVGDTVLLSTSRGPAAARPPCTGHHWPAALRAMPQGLPCLVRRQHRQPLPGRQAGRRRRGVRHRGRPRIRLRRRGFLVGTRRRGPPPRAACPACCRSYRKRVSRAPSPARSSAR